MKCEQLIGPAEAPRRCTVPATYTLRCTDHLPMAGSTKEFTRHFCVMHARKEAARMDRTFWEITRDADGLAL